ncbi:unnamed protein product [Ilex paraguariensis]|uniref:Uncharacterized protein n=1 Tax=Ilex paraguariensis TaxID=185542 RepID=A0ABC8UKD9_9AQUA
MGDNINAPCINGSEPDLGGRVAEPVTTKATTKGLTKPNLVKGKTSLNDSSNSPSRGEGCGIEGGGQPHTYRTPWNQVLSLGRDDNSSNPTKEMKPMYIEPIKRESRIIVEPPRK